MSNLTVEMITHLAAPNGLGLALAGLGEDRGEGVADELERGSNSSLRRVICGVGGTELLAINTNQFISSKFSLMGLKSPYSSS